VPNPIASFSHTASETLVSFYRPFDEPPVEPTKNPHKVVFPKPAVVVDPASNHWIEVIRNSGDSTFCPAVKT